VLAEAEEVFRFSSVVDGDEQGHLDGERKVATRMNGAVLLGILLLAGVLGGSGGDISESSVKDSLRVAVVPSNQHHQKYAGQRIDGRQATEEDWALVASAACVAELEKLGFDARVFHIPGEGYSPQDELEEALGWAVLWDPDLVVSLHSTQGSADSQPEVQAIYGYDDRDWAHTVTESVAEQLGIPARGPMWRGRLLFYRVLNAGGFKGEALLLEIGQHSVARDAEWNLENADEQGQAVARALVGVSLGK
jgi:hypothetical protein